MSGYSIEVGLLTEAIKKNAAAESRLAAVKKALEFTRGLGVWLITVKIGEFGKAYLHPSPGPAEVPLENLYPKVLDTGLALLEAFCGYTSNVDQGLRQVATTYLAGEEETRTKLAACD